MDKVAFTGSTEVGKAIRTLAGSGKKLTLEQGGQHRLRGRPLDQAVEGIVNGIYFNQGHVCVLSRLLVQESIAEPLVDKLKRHATLRVGDPLDKNTDVGAINSRPSWTRSPSWSPPGRPTAPGPGGRRASCPRGVLVPADGVHLAAQSLPHRPGGDLRAGAVGADLPHPRRGGGEGQQHPLRAVGRAGVWTDKGSRILDLANRMRAGVVWANTFNRFDPTSLFGGYKESGFGREGGRHGLAAYLDLCPAGLRAGAGAPGMHRRASPLSGTRPSGSKATGRRALGHHLVGDQHLLRPAWPAIRAAG